MRHDTHGQPYYELRCDNCGTALSCTNESHHAWDNLRNTADARGWNASRESPTGPHYCPACTTTR